MLPVYGARGAGSGSDRERLREHDKAEVCGAAPRAVLALALP